MGGHCRCRYVAGLSPLCIIITFLLVQSTNLVQLDFLFPQGPGVDTLLAKGFEVSSEAVQLNVPIVFYGEKYDYIYVNTNGLLSFQTDIPTFINIQFPLDYPVIAPLYTNIDTRSSGYVSYRETNDSGILYRMNKNIQNLFKNASNFQATSVFIATWYEVGYYANGNDKVNTFQVVIGSNGTDSYIELIYPEGKIQWIQGQISESGLPDARAQAGFISHDNRMFILPGSGTDQISNIDKLSNTNLPGLWVFHVGLIKEDGQIEQPDILRDNLIEPTAKETCQIGYTKCHSKARCVDLEKGFCCVCNEGYFGNGQTCLRYDTSLRLIGKVSGTINGEKISQLDLHSYIVPSDGRAYTAISKIPVSIGYSLPILNIIGRVVSWLVAKKAKNVKNGYDLTGGKFNHSAILTFPTTGDKITIWNNYHGLDVFDQLRLDTEIVGTIPKIPEESQVSLSVTVEEFTFTGKGILQSQSEQYVKLSKEGEKIPYSVVQSFSYTPCQYDEPSNITSFKMKTKNIFNKYEKTEKIIRYGTSSKLVPLTEEDPCLYGSTTCMENSYCLVEGDSFRCVCHPGYQHIYDANGNVLCVDVNECTSGTHYCDKNARCINEEGSFTCVCDPGYTGDGRTCTSEQDQECEDQCDPNAECIINGETYCQCKPGFIGDGLTCEQEQGESESDCRTDNICSPYGQCAATQQGEYICVCVDGYTGNGIQCVPVELGSENVPVTSYTEPPQPTTESTVRKYAKQCDADDKCWCPEGYLEEANYCIRDPNYKRPEEELVFSRPLVQCLDSNICFCPPGYYYTNISSTCIPNPGSTHELMGSTGKKWQCNTLNNCHPQAQCVFDPIEGHYQCQCNVDYEGDGYTCIKRETGSCRETQICGENAECVYSEDSGIDICVCLAGYEGDGFTCLKREDECTSRNDCGENGDCQVSVYTQRYECVCFDGFSKDENGICQPVSGASCGAATCIENAQCLYDYQLRTYYCQCNSGYIGDGVYECKPQPSDCSIQNNCGSNAYCEYDRLVNGYLCKCEFGYFGDGYNCTSERTCEVDPYLCDQFAHCILGPENKYVCQCGEGYIGNGSYCKVAPKLESGFLLASQEIATFRIPFDASKKNPGKTINIKANQFAIAIDIDCREGRVYWSDLDEKKIKSSEYDGSEFKEFLTTEIGSPEGLSVDWVSRNIFWVDAHNKTIEVANLESKLRKILFYQNVVNPRGIAVHPYRGKIFWSDWNRLAPKIEWANMDGTERGIFLQGESGSLPNSLAMDWLTDRLCYADAGSHKIECVDIDTRTKEAIYANCEYPFGLAITPTHFYWTDWKTLKIESVDRATKSVRKSLDVPLGGFSKLYGLVAVPDKCPAISNVCQYSNGNCSPGHLCLPNGKGGRTCVCAAEDICNDL